MRPVEVGPNQLQHFYRGGESISALRGTPVLGPNRPEDWVGSTTSRWDQGEEGQTRLPDGTKLVDAVAGDPQTWLGPQHQAYFGTGTALLVKLLDPMQRLPVHVHPQRRFALHHLGSRHGKTEAWIVLGAKGAEPTVWLGWSREVGSQEMTQWVDEQDGQAMLANMNRLLVEPGMSVVVPAGTVHAIGPGVFCAELQEPTDFSIMLETAGFGIDISEGELGLGKDTALSCVRESHLTSRELEALQRHNAPLLEPMPAGSALTDDGDLLAPAAKPYFRAQRLGESRPGPVEPSFSVLVCTWGEGRLVGGDWEVPVRAGSTVVVPFAAGTVFVNGRVELLRCLPPLPADAQKDDPASQKR